MNKLEIIKLWADHGIVDIESYHKVKGETYESFHAFADLFKDKLDADTIDPKEFWKAADEVFGYDPVCNSTKHGESNELILKTNILEINRKNHNIALHGGLIGCLERAEYNCVLTDLKPTIIEIGAGYGSLKQEWIDKQPPNHIEYTAFDIIPRFDSCIEIEGNDGTFSEEQVEKYKDAANIVYCCNVTQHLSKKQNEKYIDQIKQILIPGGKLIILYCMPPVFMHYGQTIQMFSETELFKLCAEKKFALDFCGMTYSRQQKYMMSLLLSNFKD